MAEKEESSGSLWLAILRVLWDMRWRFLGFAALLVGIHFALQYGDVLFPHRRNWTDIDTLLAILFGGMIFWGYSSDTRKRIVELEKRVKELEATKPEGTDQ
jgi:hypothetical protein